MKRKQLHECVRECLPLFESQTKNDKVVIAYSGKKNKKFKSRQEGQLKFTLHKSFIDTQSAINMLARKLNKKPNDFFVAGNKDKRGVTTQQVYCGKLSVDHLMRNRLGKNWPENIEIGNFEEGAQPLHLGDHYGNRFKIALRMFNSKGLTFLDLQKRVELLEKDGFINYFGLQRFGSNKSCRTHEIGKLVVTQQFEKAFRMILLQDTPWADVQTAKNNYIQDWNHKKLLNVLPRACYIERAMVEGLQKAGGKNWLQALQSIPRNIRNLYPHAWQSYVWNKVASLRVKQGGPVVLPGDLVFSETHGFVTVTEDQTARYTIFDITIPLLGKNTKLPSDSTCAKHINEVLAEEGITIEMINSSNPQFMLQGDYRRLFCKPEELAAYPCAFEDKDQDLLRPFDSVETMANEHTKGQHSAILLEFSLVKSSYATMLIREFCHISSSFEVQESINQEADKQEETNPDDEENASQDDRSDGDNHN